ncbi:sensor histidine kinase [Streptomyces sp. NPDC035033]|uniref:sensor histidine kinase n=1 Tax=Streptomyces sp. NPDC035033 TaxID=3155368 RepID=UPI0033F9518B
MRAIEKRPAARRSAARLRDGARAAVRALEAAFAAPAPPGSAPFAGASSRWVRLLPYVFGVALVASLLPVTVNLLVHDYDVPGALAGALATAQTAPLLLAATRPLRAWWVVLPADVAGALVLMASDGPQARLWPWTPPAVVGYCALMLALGLREPRRTLVGVWLATGAAGYLLETVRPYGGTGLTTLLFVLGGVLLLLASAVRERSEAQRRLAEQETISEAERARRTLLEERARIARELHDVVAHHMSVITVQADSAPYRIPELPEAAREEFAAIAGSARESLAEMRRLLAVLRSDGGEGERAPQPGLDRLQQLVEATVRAGLPAELSLSAELADGRTEVPQAVGLSAYRIVQEALANVVRHAPGAPTRVSVREDGAGRLTVLVVNGPAAEPVAPLETTGTGHGLVGMRERVRLTGGTLDTGPLPDGGFRVAARLPLGTEGTPSVEEALTVEEAPAAEEAPTAEEAPSAGGPPPGPGAN